MKRRSNVKYTCRHISAKEIASLFIFFIKYLCYILALLHTKTEYDIR